MPCHTIPNHTVSYQQRDYKRPAKIQHEQHDQTERALFLIFITLEQYVILKGVAKCQIFYTEKTPKSAINPHYKLPLRNSACLILGSKKSTWPFALRTSQYPVLCWLRPGSLVYIVCKCQPKTAKKIVVKELLLYLECKTETLDFYIQSKWRWLASSLE